MRVWSFINRHLTVVCTLGFVMGLPMAGLVACTN